jgi:2-polyprenyl-3-methyl-5-hydroxy-6-metoxy-1,4-benzoquinol methylase
MIVPKDKKTVLGKVNYFFDDYSEEFDSIYDDRKNNFLNNIINKFLRQSMFGRYALTLDEILKNKERLKILDIGCGSGRYCKKFASYKHNVLGIDVSVKMIEIAKKYNEKYINKFVNFQVIDYMNFKTKNKFNYAILMGFFDYIDEPLNIFKKLKNDTEIALASFPKKYHLLTPQRAIRYKLNNCPLFFYTKKDIVNLMNKVRPKSFTITDNSREFFLICEF